MFKHSLVVDFLAAGADAPDWSPGRSVFDNQSDHRTTPTV